VSLRFTTGAMLLYSGAMNIALYRAIRAGRRWAIGVGVQREIEVTILGPRHQA
jgi:hypothetical protein